ncbi:MAG: hypothetical protein ACR2P0_09315 [Acidimicrobiales bacterium]
MRALMAVVIPFFLVATACGSDSGSDTGDSALAPIEISDMLAGDAPVDVSVIGYVIIDGAGARLCEALAESFPPQCGGASVIIDNPDALTVALQQEQSVQWTDERVRLDGNYDGGGLILAS